MKTTAKSTTAETLMDVIHGFQSITDTVAIRYRTRFRTFSWTYQETLKNVLKTRALLRDHGVEAGDPVMIWGPNSPYWVWVYLAAILHGSPVVPMDMGSNLKFVEKVIRETETSLLFSSRLNSSPSESVSEFTLESLGDEIESISPASATNRKITRESIAEIVYTSGTTGTPKGTKLTHGNLVANQNALSEAIRVPITGQIRFLSLLPLSHVFEQTVGFWYPVHNGNRITYLETLKPSEIFEGLVKEEVHILVGVPRLLSLFRDSILRKAEERGKKEKLESMLGFAGDHLPFSLRRILFHRIHSALGGSLRYFVVGGAPLDSRLEQFWLGLGFEVLQGYGLTESSPILTCNRPDARKPGTVGKPLPGVSLKLEDDGEILARGDNIFPGYFNRPEKTDEVFSNGWFRTGDIGEFDEDGYLIIRGREKNVIVTSEGLNVYPEDVEEILNREESVRDSCVIDLNDKITAVFLPEGPEFEGREIVNRTNEHLSEAQKIQDWKIWPEDDFPRTTTMKIRRMEVREEFENREEEGHEPDSMQITDSFTRVLSNVSDIDPDQIQNDMRLGPDLGLSSIDRMELVTLIEQDMHVDLEEESITSSTTVEDLRKEVESGGGGKTEDKFRRWTRNSLCNGIRYLSQKFLFFPLLRSLYGLRVRGRDNLVAVDGPCVFISNHQSHLDTPAVMDALPGKFSSRMAVAAWEEYFEIDENQFSQRLQKNFLWNFTTIFFNIFPIPQSRGFRKSMRYIGELLDNDWNVLFFPEGERTVDGSMNPFRRGIGIIAREMKVPIVPVRIDGLDRILPRHTSIPRPGVVNVQFGKPILSFDSRLSYQEISNQLWNQINDMSLEDKEQKNAVPVRFFTKEDCLLCHKAKQRLSGLAEKVPIDLESIDIESDPKLFEKYKNSVPVIFIGDELASKGKLNERRFMRIAREKYKQLGQANERENVREKKNEQA